MKYESLQYPTREEIETSLCSPDIEEVRRAAAVLSNDEDWSWAFERLAELTNHSDVWVAGSAVIGLADLVRLGHPIDLSALDQMLKRIALDRPELAGRVESALEDVEVFARTQSRGSSTE